MPSRQAQTLVSLNVYDLVESNQYTSILGLGVYHSGLVIGNEEFTFSNSGIFEHTPKEIDENAVFKETLKLGYFNGTYNEAKQLINSLRDDFASGSYHVVFRNCNHFANEASTLLTGNPIPAYVNRLSYLGSFVSCLIPKDINQQSRRSITFGTRQNHALQSKGSAFNGTGHSLGGYSGQKKENDLVDRREKAKEAALRRMQQHTS